MPDWQELAGLLAHDSAIDAKQPPLAITQTYERLFGRVQLIEAIRAALHPDRAGPGSSHRAFVNLPFDTIYTTNFDLLLEAAYAAEGRPFRSLVGELQLPFHAGQTASNLVKMHGDLRHEEHMIVTQRDYDEFLERYPMVATHLSAMLITRTPLFIGYSLSDPDFLNIRRIVRERLGRFERMGYIVQFDIDSGSIERALDDQIHIISLKSRGGHERALEAFFVELQAQLDARANIGFRASRPDIFERVEPELVRRASASRFETPLMEATSRMAFVLMPFSPKFDQVYRSFVSPVLEEFGLKPLRADEIQGSGFILEQIRSAIQQARLCIADITGSNPNVLYEVGYAHALAKPLILIAEEDSRLPFDVAAQRVLFYGPDGVASRNQLIKAVTVVLSEDRLEDATRLLEAGHFNPAVATASVVLEQELRRRLSRSSPRNLERMSLGLLINEVARRQAMDPDLLSQLRDIVSIRNQAVHTLAPVSEGAARSVLTAVRRFVEAKGD